jgi:hypothetical protein
MARHPKTTLWMLIRVVRKKRYVRIEKVANGRYIPAVVGPYEPGSYYLRYTLKGNVSGKAWAVTSTLLYRSKRRVRPHYSALPSECNGPWRIRRDS